MKIPRSLWLQVFSLVLLTAFLSGCGMTGSSGPSSASSLSPNATAISPDTGSTSGGTTVTISGKNLQSGATVTFGGVAAKSVNVLSSSQMTAVTPAHTAGPVDVEVTNPNGKSDTLGAAFGYGSAAPTVSAISPNSGPIAGGTAVTITGKNFVAGALVFLGTVAASGVAVNSSTQIQAITPSVSTAAAENVVVQNPDGQSGTLSNGFTYTDPPPSSAPTVSSVSPGTATAGTAVTVDGTNFGSGATVNVGSTAASNVQFLSSTQLSATVPSVSPGTYDVTVANTNGLSATLSGGLTVASPTSLLSGCTVTTSGTVGSTKNGSPAISCSTPSGWTLISAEDFAGGVQHASDKTQLHGLGGGGTVQCSLTDPAGHCAYDANISSNGQSFRWTLDPGAIGSSSEVYLSWYEYTDTNIMPEGELFLADALENVSTNPQGDILDWWTSPNNCLNGTGPGNSYNCQDAQVVISPQSNASGGVNAAYYVGYLNMLNGAWRHYEYHFKANTPGSSDGSAELYVDGQLFASWSNENFNGSLDMSGMGVDIGGTATSGSNFTDGTYSACATAGSTSYQKWDNPFTAAAPCPVVPSFNRYWTDIIVLAK